MIRAGQDNPACTAFKKRANDFTENARSLGFRLVFGRFTFLDLGDLVWNELGQLVCPKNLLGEAGLRCPRAELVSCTVACGPGSAWRSRR